MGLSSNLSTDLCNISSLSARDIKQLQLLITDFFAASFAGYKLNKDFNKAIESILFSQGGSEESIVFLNRKKLPARSAAFINSVYGHGAELDDGNKEAAGHAGVHIIPAVFALADKLKSKNNDVLIALTTGYETYIRISSAAQPGMISRGYHSTGVAGTLACAAACARLFHFDSKGIENSIALATTMTGGLLSYGDSRPSIKPINPGKAAENGIMSAMLVFEGVQGPEESLEGKNGWFNAVTDTVNYEYLKGKGYYLFHDCYIKLYPSCRHTHSVIDAAISLHNRVKTELIDSIRVYIYPNAIKLAGIKKPCNQDETKFSIFYTLACALVNGKYGIDDMDPSKITPRIRCLMEKTVLIPDESFEDREKGIRGTRVEVYYPDGTKYDETVLVPRGEPDRPLNYNDVVEKLKVCSKGFIGDVKRIELVDSINSIEGETSFKNPMNILGVK